MKVFMVGLLVLVCIASVLGEDTKIVQQDAAVNDNNPSDLQGAEQFGFGFYRPYRPFYRPYYPVYRPFYRPYYRPYGFYG